MISKRVVSSMAASFFLVGGLVATGGAAQAATEPSPPPSAVSTSTPRISADQSAEVNLPDGSKIVTTLGTPQTASVQQIENDPTLTSAQKTELATLAAAAAVSSNHYSQFTTGGAYTVTHNGTFYYNGSRVWVGSTYLGYTGSHNCFINYAPGISITNIGCSESGGPTQRDMYMQWTVGVGPFAYGVNMTAKLYTNGTISGFGATVG